MKVTETVIPGIKIIEPKVFEDSRGFFMETYSAQRYFEAGIDSEFVQDNVSFSKRGTLRGLHFQNPQSQGKLVTVIQGEVFDVMVDLRRGSPTFGEWFGIFLSSENKLQVWVPKGFAHGFQVTSESALLSYKCDALYCPGNEKTLLWNDPDLAIEWPDMTPQLSAKDQAGTRLLNLGESLFY